ncbi:ABC transporter substrate-binding protein [Phytoactinopolyspora halotolerans]|uniref:ABC transporter substrate-binding protein n=1 Tax=Phytoactinopolyspora halotolerans TaxID=1981512 RepID=A0A6L9S610_9ACTN|nr:ABC transporter substrate-binding protein [Phytoactinopolyspora halotolerans]NEE00477.1 ABC transporter substrate-binding protein [Phytoactinopolyspora halotolerans]
MTFLPLESFTFAPEMMAYSGGYFEEHGLDVTLEPVQGTSAAIQSVVGDAAFITRASTIDIVPAMEDGQQIVGVGTMARQTNLRIASSTDDPVESTADMTGKTIGMGSIGGTSERALDLALTHDGIDPGSVERQAVPVTAATFELVRRGELAGYIVSLDTALTLDDQNDDAVVGPAGLDVTPDLQLYFTTPDTLENDPETVEAFLAAMADATQFMVDDRENNYDETLQILRDSGDWDFPALFDDEAARGALEVYTTETWMDDSGTPLMHTDPDVFAEAYDALAAGGLVEGGADPQDWITNDYVP